MKSAVHSLFRCLSVRSLIFLGPVSLGLGLVGCQSAPLTSPALTEIDPRRATHEARAPHAMISTQGAATTEAAREILKQGGNLIDAAITASFMISVERPHSTGIGGGGFLVYRDAKTGKATAFDFRERAPLKAREKMYLDAKGDVVPDLSLDGALAVGTPGLVAGLMEMHRRWGSLPLSRLVAPAVKLARSGFAVYPALARAFEDRKEVLARFPASRKIFLKADGTPYQVGETLVQADLARTLERIGKYGKKGFYRGPVAAALLATSRKYGGLLSQKDLETYTVKERTPVRGTFKEYELISMPPPSSGGTHVVQILNILEPDSLKSFGFHSASQIHQIASAMQLAFADRAHFMGDPDFVKVPVAGLLRKDYALKLRASIPPARARRADEVGPGTPPGYESAETTHFSLIDDAGNMVASTQTINGWMGSGLVAEGTGMLLNNEMDDFSAKPGAANLFGAVGGSANAIAPRKTPLSSMSPTLVLKAGQPWMVVGAPGGTRIITCVAQTLLNFLEMGLPLYESVALPRFHHQWKPDRLLFDAPGPSLEVQAQLRTYGYDLQIAPDAVHCAVMAVAREGAGFVGVSDPRDAGTAAGL